MGNLLLVKNIVSYEHEESMIMDALVSCIREDSKILDFGCGQGLLVDRLLSANKRFCYIGIDTNGDSIEKFSQKIENNRWGNICKCYHLSYPKFEKFNFNACICSRVFHHLNMDTAMRTFTSIFNQMLNGGQIIIVETIRDFSQRLDRYLYRPSFFINMVATMVSKEFIDISGDTDFELNDLWIMNVMISENKVKIAIKKLN